jgi:NTE family protein
MRNLLFISLLLLAVPCHAQPTSPYKNLVFEGAGIRGLAYGGAIEELEKQGILSGIEKVGGTSAGAITALLLALDYTSNEITELVYQTDYNRFNSGRFFFLGGLYRMKKRYGWYRGDKFSAWLENAIRTKTGNSDITFAELQAQGYKALYITATCLNRQQLLVFSHESYPHMKIKDAVRISMSIPLYFEAVFIDQTGRVISKPTPTAQLDLVMDGGITANFPIFLFDSLALSEQPEQRIPNPATLGIRIDSEEQIVLDQGERNLVHHPVNSLQEYFQAFYIYVLENLNRPQLTDADWQRTISVSSAGIGPRVKRLSPAQKQALLDSGTKGVLEFLATPPKQGLN